MGSTSTPENMVLRKTGEVSAQNQFPLLYRLCVGGKMHSHFHQNPFLFCTEGSSILL